MVDYFVLKGDACVCLIMQCLVNVLRACIGLPPESFMALEHRLPTLMAQTAAAGGKKRASEDEQANGFHGHHASNGKHH